MHNNLEESKKDIEQLQHEPDLIDVPILIVANRIDKSDLSIDQIYEQLEL